MSLVPFNPNPNPNPISNYNFQEKKNSQVMKERENFIKILTKVVIG